MSEARENENNFIDSNQIFLSSIYFPCKCRKVRKNHIGNSGKGKNELNTFKNLQKFLSRTS